MKDKFGLTVADKIAIAELAAKLTRLGQDGKFSPKIFVGACAVAGKAMANLIGGKPIDDGMEFMNPSYGDDETDMGPTPVSGPAPKSFKI